MQPGDKVKLNPQYDEGTLKYVMAQEGLELDVIYIIKSVNFDHLTLDFSYKGVNFGYQDDGLFIINDIDYMAITRSCS